MSFIRPEARAALWRWREVLAGVIAGAIGISWVLGPGGLLGWIGWALIVAGVAIILVGVQRIRFRLGEGGPGIVQIDEGQIAYFGPLTGGVVAVSDLGSLKIDNNARPAHWILERIGQPPVAIPVNAAGTEALFDVFSSLPGLRTESMLAALRSPDRKQIVIWRRDSQDLPSLPRQRSDRNSSI